MISNRDAERLLKEAEADAIDRARKAVKDRFIDDSQRGRLIGIAEGLRTARILLRCKEVALDAPLGAGWAGAMPLTMSII